MTTKTDELFETITGRIIEAIETGNHGKWEKPWTTMLAQTGLPTNATTNKPYNGMNALIGLVEQAVNAYESGLWATYRQWASKGAQVRKGEKGTKMVKWGVTYRCSACDHKGQRPCSKSKQHVNDKHVWASSFTVFNADQVDGFEVPKADTDGMTEPERMEAVEAFIAATGANIKHVAGDRAFYTPSADAITLPLREQFETPQGYYGTALHELTHWTGADHRLDRESGRIFGDSRYAWEELVAELGATFLAAHFGIEVEPHDEHAAYLGSWLRTLKDEPRALYRAAKLAQEAVTFLLDEAKVEAVKEAA